MSFTLDRQNFDRSVINWRLKMGQSLKAITLDEGRLLVRDLIKLTPPRGTNPMSQSYGEQRKLGFAAVERDVKRVLRPLTELDIVQKPRHPQLRDALLRAAGVSGGKGGRKRLDFEETKRLIQRLGIKNDVIRKADGQIHRRARGSRGRVPKGSHFTVVVQPLTVARYIREAQKSVGRAKKGWMVAAAMLGTTGIPQWIAGNQRPADGSYVFDNRNPLSPAIIVSNKVQYASDFRALGITDFAVKLRRANMIIKGKRAMAALARQRL